MSKIWMPDRRVMAPYPFGTVISGGLPPEPAPIWLFDPYSQGAGSLNTYLSTNFPGSSFQRASKGLAYDSVAQQHYYLDNDISRGVNYGNDIKGFLIEHAVTNRVGQTRRFDLMPNAGVATTVSDSGIDFVAGTGVNSRRFVVAANANPVASNYEDPNLSSGGPWTCSVWHRQFAGGSGNHMARFAAVFNMFHPSTSTWARAVRTNVANDALFYIIPVYRENAVNTYDLVVDLAMVEATPYATSATVGFGAAFTRQDDSLTFLGAPLLTGGSSQHMRLEVAFWPLGASTDYSGTKTIFSRSTGGTSDSLSINMATMVATLRVRNADFVLGTNTFPTFNGNDLIETWSELGGTTFSGVVKVRKNGGSPVTLGTVSPGSMMDLDTAASSIRFMHNGSGGSQLLACVNRRAAAYASTSRLNWAA